MEFHKHILSSIAARLEGLPHALLIHGPKGVGKLALARRLAQLILCEAEGRRDTPCGNCPGCRWFAAGSHPDVRFVEPEILAHEAAGTEGEETPTRKTKPSAEIRIEQVRELADFLNLGSHRGRRRVAIVHPAEDMNAHAANALLKSLEEPPGSAMFLLVSHRPGRLLPTIRSRCVAVPVPVPEAAAACAWLERQGVRDSGRWLAFAGGAPYAALELATSDQGALVEGMLAALSGGNLEALESPADREALERLAEVLQKHALDCALAAFGALRKYTPGGGTAAPSAAQARAWLAYARAMGRNRALARHPLNPRLFALEMLQAMPRS